MAQVRRASSPKRQKEKKRKRRASNHSMMPKPLPSCLTLPLSLNLSRQSGSPLPISYLPKSSAWGQTTDAQSSLPLRWHLSKLSLVRYLQAQPAVGNAAWSLPRMLSPSLCSAEACPPASPRWPVLGGGQSIPLLSLGLPLS